MACHSTHFSLCPTGLSPSSHLSCNQRPQQLCFPIPDVLQAFFGIWNLIVFRGGLPELMLLFSFSLCVMFASRLVESLLKICQTSFTQVESQKRRNKADRQMMLVQCFMFTLTASPASVQYIYTSVRPTIVVDSVQRAKYNFFYTIVGFVSLTVPCTSLYLFTLSGTLIRHELVRLLVEHRRSVQPSTVHSQNDTG